LKIYAWVILENHLHAILAAPDLSQVLADFKRHTARRLLEQLQAEECDWLLNQLHYFRAKHKAESAYQVWQAPVGVFVHPIVDQPPLCGYLRLLLRRKPCHPSRSHSPPLSSSF